MTKKIKTPPRADLPTLKTKDLNLTAFLSARGSSLLAVDRKGGACYFTLEAEDIEELVRDFYGNGNVRILDFCGRLRQLRAIIHNDVGLPSGLPRPGAGGEAR